MPTVTALDAAVTGADGAAARYEAQQIGLGAGFGAHDVGDARSMRRRAEA